jgi:hypothetical protein
MGVRVEDQEGREGTERERGAVMLIGVCSILLHAQTCNTLSDVKDAIIEVEHLEITQLVKPLAALVHRSLFGRGGARLLRGLFGGVGVALLLRSLADAHCSLELRGKRAASHALAREGVDAIGVLLPDGVVLVVVVVPPSVVDQGTIVPEHR